MSYTVMVTNKKENAMESLSKKQMQNIKLHYTHYFPTPDMTREFDEYLITVYGKSYLSKLKPDGQPCNEYKSQFLEWLESHY